MFERLMEGLKNNEHRLAYAGLALVYGAGCLWLDKMAVQVLVAFIYLVLAVRG